MTGAARERSCAAFLKPTEMKHTGVYTAYTSGKRTYGSYIIAADAIAAAAIARERKLGETIVSKPVLIEPIPDYSDISDEAFVQLLPQIMHHVILTGFIAGTAGKISIADLLGDEGILHQLSLLQQGACLPLEREEFIAMVRRQLYLLQQKVPGAFPPCHAQKGFYIIVKVRPQSRVTIGHIVKGSALTNLGPAAITVCDCETDPSCGITDDDQPCGYHQTIDAMASATLLTSKDKVHIVNRDRWKTARVKIRVQKGIG